MNARARAMGGRLRLDRFYVLTDILALVLAYACALKLRFSAHLGPVVYGFVNGLLKWGGALDLSSSAHRLAYGADALRYLVPFALALHFLYAMQGMYHEHRFLRRRPVLWQVLVSNGTVLAAVIGLLYFRRNTWHPRSFFVTVFVLNTVFCPLLRVLARRLVSHLRRTRGWWLTPTVLVGETPEARTVEEIIEYTHPHGVFIAARVPAPVSGDLAPLAHALEQTGARLVIVADDSLSVAVTMHILDLTARMNAAAKVLTHELAVLQTKAGEDFDTIRGTPLVHFEDPSVSDKNTVWRRILSRALAAVALVALSPVLLVTALLIKLTDPGPVFFVQERFGVDRRPFRMYKFRTMRVDAEKLLAQLEAQNEAGGGLFKLKKDPRITPIGRFLRRYSIDELPQIINVLKGDMRIVGPRPLPRRDVNNYYEEWHYHRHNGRPGLTCLWQVSGRSEIDFQNMCILDVYYLRNRNWPMDLRIVARTVGVVVLGNGAY
jgi:exopolysaccharide biosynthesis polyprenyl glycosylphosphotransferase